MTKRSLKGRCACGGRGRAGVWAFSFAVCCLLLRVFFVFVAGSFHGTFDAVSFGRRGSLEFGSHYAGDGAGRVASRKERGRMTNKQYRVDGTNIRARAGRSDKYLVVYISTPRFFCVVITSLYSSAMSRPITFEPLPLRPRSALQLYIGAACMFTISLLSALLALSYFYCPAQITWLRPLCEDEHYKYLVPLLIPVTTWFAIANWVGWEYFRFA